MRRYRCQSVGPFCAQRCTSASVEAGPKSAPNAKAVGRSNRINQSETMSSPRGFLASAAGAVHSVIAFRRAFRSSLTTHGARRCPHAAPALPQVNRSSSDPEGTFCCGSPMIRKFLCRSPAPSGAPWRTPSYLPSSPPAKRQHRCVRSNPNMLKGLRSGTDFTVFPASRRLWKPHNFGGHLWHAVR
jgi:hypothetical protein